MGGRTARGSTVEEEVSAGDRAVVVEVMRGDEESDSGGGRSVGFETVRPQVERRLNPFPFPRGSPVKLLLRAEPAIAGRIRFDEPQFSVLNECSRRLCRVELNLG